MDIALEFEQHGIRADLRRDDLDVGVRSHPPGQVFTEIVRANASVGSQKQIVGKSTVRDALGLKNGSGAYFSKRAETAASYEKFLSNLTVT